MLGPAEFEIGDELEAPKGAVGKGVRKSGPPLLDWQYDINESARRSARWAWAVAGLAVVVALAALGAVAALAPLKSVEPVFVRVDAETGAIDVLHRIEEVIGISADEALDKGYAARYVTSREGYFFPRVQDDYRKVLRMSVGEAKDGYVAAMAAENPDAPANVYGDQAEVKIKLKSIAFLPGEKGTVQVRFLRTVVDRDGEETRSHHVATLRYNYEPDAEIPLSALIDNAMGYAVSEYSVQQEDAS